MKRFVCTLMALAMTLALTIPAFAASTLSAGSFNLNTSGTPSAELQGITKAPTVQVFVPSESGTGLILNPYGLKVTLASTISGLTGDTSDQVFSKPLFVGSLSDVPLNLSVKVVATKGDNVVLASKTLKGTTTTTKSVFLWGQVVDAGTTASGNKVPAVPTSFSSTYNASTASMIQVGPAATGTDGVSKSNIHKIPAAASTTDVSKATWACMKFFGDAVKAPTEGWTGADNVNLTVTFSFTASMNEA